MNIKKFQNSLKTTGILYNSNIKDPTIKYLLGKELDHCWLIIRKKGVPLLLVNGRDYEQVKSYKLPVKLVKNKKLSEVLKKKTFGINFECISASALEKIKKELKLKAHDISSLCKEIREIKNKEEIKRTRKACKIADDIMMKTISKIKNFKTEEDVKDFILHEMKKHNVKPSFDVIVASGKNAAYPHHNPGKDKLKGFVIIDLGVFYKNYCSDITRTVYLGKPSEKEKELYNLVLKSQEEAIKILKSGIKAKAAEEKARKILGKQEKYFVHSLGHQIGVEIHEGITRLSKNCEEKLKENMILTVEPGIYIPGKLGIRIEDDVLITKKGAEVLTKSNKNLIRV